MAVLLLLATILVCCWAVIVRWMIAVHPSASKTTLVPQFVVAAALTAVLFMLTLIVAIWSVAA